MEVLDRSPPRKSPRDARLRGKVRIRRHNVGPESPTGPAKAALMDSRKSATATAQLTTLRCNLKRCAAKLRRGEELSDNERAIVLSGLSRAIADVEWRLKLRNNTGRPRSDKPRCECGKMTATRAKTHRHKCA
jgi:hypothetical protein